MWCPEELRERIANLTRTEPRRDYRRPESSGLPCSLEVEIKIVKFPVDTGAKGMPHLDFYSREIRGFVSVIPKVVKIDTGIFEKPGARYINTPELVIGCGLIEFVWFGFDETGPKGIHLPLFPAHDCLRPIKAQTNIWSLPWINQPADTV